MATLSGAAMLRGLPPPARQRRRGRSDVAPDARGWRRSVEILLLVSARVSDPSAVLPSLDLLPHTVRTAPRDVRTLVSAPTPDAVLVDARTELSDARATCRMLNATGLGVPLIAIVTEA